MNSTVADDKALVAEARKGSHAAFRQLVERHQQKVYAMALSVLRDPDSARDAAQDAFVKAYQHLADFQGDSSFYTWVYRIAMNLCIDRTRRAKKFAEVEYDETLPPDPSAMAPEPLGFDPQRALADKEIRERVLAALEELSPNHRAVLTLREIDGLAYKEIAEVMNCSVGTVMSRLFHARKNMQQRLRTLVDGEAGAAQATGDEDEGPAGGGDDDAPARKASKERTR